MNSVAPPIFWIWQFYDDSHLQSAKLAENNKLDVWKEGKKERKINNNCHFEKSFATDCASWNSKCSLSSDKKCRLSSEIIRKTQSAPLCQYFSQRITSDYGRLESHIKCIYMLILVVLYMRFHLDSYFHLHRLFPRLFLIFCLNTDTFRRSDRQWWYSSLGWL